MKKMLPFLLVWFFQANPSAAQGPGDYQFQFQFDNYLHEWVQGPDGAWFGFGHSNQSLLFDESFVIKWDAVNDSLLWKTAVPLPAQEVMRDMAMLPAPDGGVYVGAVYDGCDYPTPEGLARLSASGDVIWVITTPEELRDNSHLSLLPAADGKIIFQTDKHRFEYLSDGMLLSSTSSSSFPWNGFVRNNLGGYLAYGNQAVGSFNPFIAVPFPDNIKHAVQMPSDEWLFLGTTKLYRVNTGLSIVDEIALPDTVTWSKVFWADGACWVNGGQNNGTTWLQKHDSLTLDVLNTYFFDSQYRVRSLIHVPGDSVLWLSGECYGGLNPRIFLKSVPKDNPTIEPTRSVALTDIRLGQQPVYSTNSFPCSFVGQPSTSYFFHKLFATVTNTGNTPVSRFWVNGRFSTCWSICYYQKQFSKSFEILLMPGESAEVLLTDVLVLTSTFSGNQFDLCFWTALPDDRLDAIPEDDRYCETFTLIVSDNEPVADAPTVRVMPNPAGERATFFIEGQGTEGVQHRIVVTNASGQLIRQEAFVGQNWVLERGDLPAGLYFYQLTTQRGAVQTGKLVLNR